MVRGKFQSGHDVSCRGAQYHGSRLNGEALVFERNGGRPFSIAGEKHAAGKVVGQLAEHVGGGPAGVTVEAAGSVGGNCVDSQDEAREEHGLEEGHDW